MIQIAICDDNLQELKLSYDFLVKYKKEHQLYEAAIQTFSTPIELLEHVTEHGGFDILLLDVYMPGILGTEVARELRSMGDSCDIIFLTTSRDHALDAFEVDAAQYLVKPYSEAQIFAAMDKVMRRQNIERRELITFKTSEGFVKVGLRSIVFTETGRNNYQIIHTNQGKKLEVRMTASELFELVSQNKYFVRCGASINVNLKYVRQISKDAIVFDTGEHLTYPYRAYQQLKETFLRYQMMED